MPTNCQKLFCHSEDTAKNRVNKNTSSVSYILVKCSIHDNNTKVSLLTSHGISAGSTTACGMVLPEASDNSSASFLSLICPECSFLRSGEIMISR